MAGLEKTLMLKTVKSKLENKQNIFVNSINGVNVDDIGQLRGKLSESADHAFVVKNKIARLAFKELGIDGIGDCVDGITLLVSAEKEPQVVSKTLVDFNKEKGDERFQLCGAYIEGDLHDTAYVRELASLPSRDELIAAVLGRVQAPITNFVYCLSGLMRGLVCALSEIKKQKE